MTPESVTLLYVAARARRSKSRPSSGKWRVGAWRPRRRRRTGAALRKRRPPPWAKRLGRIGLISAGLGLAVPLAVVLLLRWLPPPTTAFMLQSAVRTATAGDSEAAAGTPYRWTGWDEIAPHAALAAIAAEDQKFPDHHGFDVEAIQSALDDARDGGRLRGASTISQQTAKNLFLWPGRSLIRKGLEAYLTVLIELCWSKRRILEVYLNIAEFGDRVFGIAAASERYFGKRPADLGANEAALLAAVLPNPAGLHVDRPSPYVRARQSWIRRQMRQLGGVALVEALDTP